VDALHDPELTLSLALLAGVAGQTLAHHLRVPSIVVLLVLGVLLGPDVLGVVWPDTLGGALGSLVGFAVAVILFEGGLHLHLPELRRAGAALRNLVTVGALVTFVGAAAASKLLLRWGWPHVLLFASLLTVTGPTVVTPLVRRLRLRRDVGTLLEAEGVLIDPVGAIFALVVLELVLQPPGPAGPLVAAWALAVRLGIGAGVGVAGGASLVLLLRPRRLIPERLTNLVALGWVLVLWQVAEVVRPESGIAAVVAAGMTVRALVPRPRRELLDFKEQLTSLFIGMLFVLLAADVRLAFVTAVGWRGVATVAALMFVVRPLDVLVSTWGSDLGWREKLFLSWIAPRGIVAASVASLFAVELDEAGIPGGQALRALVFVVITSTVVTAGLTGGWLARRLGLQRPSERGWVILGANPLARRLGRALVDRGEDVVFVDRSPVACAAAVAEGFTVVQGNGLELGTLAQAEVETRRGAIGLTPNNDANWLFAERARREGSLRELIAATGSSSPLSPELVHPDDVRRLGGVPVDVERWSRDLDAGEVVEVLATLAADGGRPIGIAELARGGALPLLVARGGRASPAGDDVKLVRGDAVLLLVRAADEELVRARLAGTGFEASDARAIVRDGTRATLARP
jgi:NhaP-type Na+/H+ or K+/H+ antiporter